MTSGIVCGVNSLSLISIVCGVVTVAIGAAFWMARDPVRRALAAFPRNRPAAWLLTAAAVGWVAVIVHGAQLGRFDVAKPWFWLIVPVSYGLIVAFVDELLAARALGGLLLLAANPMLRAARVHESPWSAAVSLFAYVLVVAGIAWMLGPYRFRRWTAWLTADARVRPAAAGFLAIGLALAGLGLAVF